MADTVISEAVAAADRDTCYAIRTEVFCGEQKIGRDIEFDGLDEGCRHYVAHIGGVAVGTARARPLGDGAVKFERVAVLGPHRGRSVGRALIDRALADARADGHATAVIHSQAHAGPFYEKIGFRQEGGEFEEAGVLHIRMTRPL